MARSLLCPRPQEKIGKRWRRFPTFRGRPASFYRSLESKNGLTERTDPKPCVRFSALSVKLSFLTS
jgi:hypothetical protein